MKALRYLLIAILFIGFTSCNKDDEDKPIKNSHRIKQSITEINNNITKNEFIYENEVLVAIKTSVTNDLTMRDESSLMEFEYSTDRIYNKYSEKVDGSYVLVSTIESKTLNGLIIEETLTSLDLTKEESWNCKYQYSGSKLTHWERLSDKENTGVYSPYEKGEYIYEQNKLIEHILYNGTQEGTWEPFFKYEYTNTDEGLSAYTVHIYSEEEEFHKFMLFDCSYSNNLMSEMITSFWEEEKESWIEFITTLYNYNSYGYLTEIVQNGFTSSYYEYEEGHGNIESLYFPEDAVVKRPRYKSSKEKESYMPFYKRYNTMNFNR